MCNVNEDSDDDEAHGGEWKEIAKEMGEQRTAQHWVNQAGRNVAAERFALSNCTKGETNLRLDWSDVKWTLNRSAEPDEAASTQPLHRVTILHKHPLDNLVPTQRVFANRFSKWGWRKMRIATRKFLPLESIDALHYCALS